MASSQDDKNLVSDDEEWTSGDVCVISSDNVRFRVDGVTLTWASPVFADMLVLPSQTEKTIHLTDSMFEKAETLRLFLHLVFLNKAKLFMAFQGSCTVWRFRLESLIAFLDKYQSDKGLMMLRDVAANAVLFQKELPTDLLVFASQLNDVGLCFKIFQLHPSHQWLSDSPDPLGRRKSESLATIVHAPYSLACAIPLEYQWAMGRAALLMDPQKNITAFGHKFVELVLAIHEKHNDPIYHPLNGSFLPIVAEPFLGSYEKPEAQ